MSKHYRRVRPNSELARAGFPLTELVEITPELLKKGFTHEATGLIVAGKSLRDSFERVYKKGTRVTLHSNCNYAGCESEEEVTLEEDSTESQLDKMAEEFMNEDLQPESWFTVGDEDE